MKFLDIPTTSFYSFSFILQRSNFTLHNTFSYSRFNKNSTRMLQSNIFAFSLHYNGKVTLHSNLVGYTEQKGYLKNIHHQ